MTETIGVIYAAIGKQYLHMAVASARSLKEQCPNVAIDLFTDQSTDDPVFDQVQSLPQGTRFAKIPSMLRSRFDRTLFIDADTWIVADITDIFEILDRFDVAAAHEQYRNWEHCHKPLWTPIPNAFPQLNTGILAFRNTSKVENLLNEWAKTLVDAAAVRDQPAFRELIFLSNLRVATLPPEYNLMKYDLATRWTEAQCAPRVIHHRNPDRFGGENMPKIESLAGIVGNRMAEHIRLLIKADWQLSYPPSEAPILPMNFYPEIFADSRKKTIRRKQKFRINRFIRFITNRS